MKLQKVMALLIVVVLGLWAGAGCVTETSTPEVEATPQETAAATEVVQATNTPVPPVDDTSEMPTNTPEPPTETPVSTTESSDLPTDTPVAATDTPAPADTPAATDTPLPTDTTAPPTPTDLPTPTPLPAATATPSPAVPFYQQGASLFEQQQWDAAITEFQKAIEADPNFALTYMGLGYTYAAKNEPGPAIQNLEKYLELAPRAGNRDQVQAFINQLQGPGFNVPPGKALFAFYNYTERTWDIDIGPYFLQVPARQPGQEYNVGTIAIDPGTYIWQGHSVDGDQYIGQNRNKGFEFTVEAGDVHLEGVR